MESAHHRERRGLRFVGVAHGPVDRDHQRLAVDHHQLTVEVVDGAEPEVAVGQQLGEREVAFVLPVEQRLDRRRLEGVAVAPPVEGAGLVDEGGVAVELEQVQRADEAMVDDLHGRAA